MSDLHLPGLTRRAAEALKPFVDECLRAEEHGWLSPDPGQRDIARDVVYLAIEPAQLIELLAALRESQREVEGITGGV